jgi:hypothetical protein
MESELAKFLSFETMIIRNIGINIKEEYAKTAIYNAQKIEKINKA